jgi:hypothetical protein
MATQDGHDPGCVVCLEPFVGPLGASVGCGHVFCLRCIEATCNAAGGINRALCPLCRTKVKSVLRLYVTRLGDGGGAAVANEQQVEQLREEVAALTVCCPLMCFLRVLFFKRKRSHPCGTDQCSTKNFITSPGPGCYGRWPAAGAALHD